MWVSATGRFACGIITAIIGAKVIQSIGITKTGYSIWATVITAIITANRFAVVIISIVAKSIKRVSRADSGYGIWATAITAIITANRFTVIIISIIAQSIKRIIGADSGYSIWATAITVIITANRFAGGVISIIAQSIKRIIGAILVIVSGQRLSLLSLRQTDSGYRYYRNEHQMGYPRQTLVIVSGNGYHCYHYDYPIRCKSHRCREHRVITADSGYSIWATVIAWVFTTGRFAVAIITAIIGAKLIQSIGITKTGYSIGATVITAIITANRFALRVISIIAQSIKRISRADSGYSIWATAITAIITANRFAVIIISIIAQEHQTDQPRRLWL